ncbi:hypothetical protein GCM10017691_48650 [Pseudonocardia petroleophila]|uniref:Uncharacterized protein n=1 Tax=Pseudonocardia petroleophila TaxID=37331 RepID=A0A7G7MQA6_9PSEU|nr:hypothetical protein [Pseudonocardia petroleophila]QNG54967.1 hypothetical protein H6H00_14470 [Pseudonocardia petroleophila]
MRAPGRSARRRHPAFLTGAGVGAAVVGGLAAPLGIGTAVAVLVLLPILGVTLLLGRNRTEHPA